MIQKIPMLFATHFASACTESTTMMPTIAYPETKRVDAVEKPFGQTVPDPYRWLENDVRSDKEVASWVESQNKVTNAYLDKLPGRDIFKARLKELYNYEKFTIPVKKGSRYFYFRNSGVQNQRVLYVRDSVDGAGRVLIDPNTWAKDGATALAEWSASDDGKRLAYAVQDGGTDWRTIRVLDVNTGKVQDDEVKWARFTSIAWAKDGSGFFYARSSEPKQDAASQASVENHAVYFHAIGTPQTQDRPVYATPDQPTMIHPLINITKDVTDPAPTLLYAYGGYAITELPAFSPDRLAWVEQGGVFAIAHIRGGGEYGKTWHEAGRRQNKQNVFDDFIAAGEYLKAQGITSQDGLAIQGASNGGLLIGAVVNQRPDLFAAALPQVGVMDMLRFDKFTGGKLWVDEFGSVAQEADFRNLFKYSPYHNIQSASAYPAILATTADADDRVVPSHSFKYIAALQAADIGSKPHFVRIETGAGHGAGKPVDKAIEETADMWAFVAHWTGLDVKPTK